MFGVSSVQCFWDSPITEVSSVQHVCTGLIKGGDILLVLISSLHNIRGMTLHIYTDMYPTPKPNSIYKNIVVHRKEFITSQKNKTICLVLVSILVLY